MHAPRGDGPGLADARVGSCMAYRRYRKLHFPIELYVEGLESPCPRQAVGTTGWGPTVGRTNRLGDRPFGVCVCWAPARTFPGPQRFLPILRAGIDNLEFSLGN